MMSGRWQSLKANGFTLVELLVALTILALVISLIFSSLQFSIRTADAVEARITASERIQLVHRMLRRQLQQLLPVRRADNEDTDRIDFSGHRDAIEFVGPMPAPLLFPGLYRITLTVTHGIDSQKLLMKFQPFVENERSGAGSREWQEIVILSDISDAEWNYQDTSRPERQPWTVDWNDDNRLPDLIRLHIELNDTGDKNAVDLVVAPRITALATG
jgi:general secretion pathway protein J